MATVKSFKADVSSVSLSFERMGLESLKINLKFKKYMYIFLAIGIYEVYSLYDLYGLTWTILQKTTMKADVYWAERVEVKLIRKKVVRPTFNGKKLCIGQIWK